MMVRHYALARPQFTPKVCDTKEREERVTVPLAHSARAPILPASMHMAPILKTEDESATQLFVNFSGVVLRRKPTDENIFQDSISYFRTETENGTFT